METGIKSSFIPSDAVVSPVDRSAQRTGFGDLLILIAVVLLVASAALAVAVFLYVQYLENSSASKVQQLQIAKDAFDPALIQELTRLDDRMKIADRVLRNHVAPSAFFDILEQLTLQTISFGNLAFKMTDPQNISIQMSGVAVSVNSIALQADYLSRSGTIANPIFSNIARKQDGVHFDLSALVSPLAIRYSQRFVPSAPTTNFEETVRSPFGAPLDPNAPNLPATPIDGEAAPENDPFQ
jgi:hypothetical protein